MLVDKEFLIRAEERQQLLVKELAAEMLYGKEAGCPHKWETRFLFSSSYKVCILCGEEP